MSNLDFPDFDLFLKQRGDHIIHQIWFGTIPNKKEAEKAYISLKIYRDSWKIQNPNWYHVEWDKKMCELLVKSFYQEYWVLYQSYKHEIQRCDMARYFILHRYGGVYADMDYYCNKPLDRAFQRFDKDFYLVTTPNNGGQYVSNSFMYSKPGNVFWRRLFIEMEQRICFPIYYSRHMQIMYSTGPGILTRVYNRYKLKYKLNSLPAKLFHPYGISDDILSLRKSTAYTIHIGKGSWEKKDSKILIYMYRNIKMLMFILLYLIVNILAILR